ncbi:MAG TPA: efflux RND transporter periplasmic adaptor subunit [Gammaproteobacteria bacterium]|jgi:HlyD family secretion protein|nr:efflux RND transporter periplasmic adaptor subunit [Gammaproteobacteria bacterium]HIK76882.1 efflux RND transporter periplasmic adaptor subunit [Gammaproteobacteria bacterium]
MTRNKKIIAVIILLLVASSFFYQGNEDAIKVIAVKPEIRNVEQSVSNTRAGTIDACRRSKMSPAMGGQIAVLAVEEGDMVEKGQVLLELWNKETKARVKAAQRSAEQTCIISAKAQRDAERANELFSKGLTSDEAKEAAVTNAESGAAACNAAKAQVEVSQASLERTQLIAPFGGIVAEIEGELGEYVTPSPVGVATKPTLDLIDNTCIYIKAPIDEIDAPEVIAGLKARITMDAFGQKEFPATVRRVAPYVLDLEKQARTVEIEAVFDNPQEFLLPGYSADITIIIDTSEATLSIPSQALMGGGFVYLINSDNSISKKEIEVGLSNWQHTEVLEGLTLEDEIVLSVDRLGLEDGVRVTIEEIDNSQEDKDSDDEADIAVKIG